MAGKSLWGQVPPLFCVLGDINEKKLEKSGNNSVGHFLSYGLYGKVYLKAYIQKH